MSPKNQILSSRIAIILLASMVSIGLKGQTPPLRPSLVVGIMVDGLSYDQLDMLKGYFGENGFKRLMRDGVTLTDVDYGSPLDPAAATAVIYTGAGASINGLSAENRFDRASRRVVPYFLDNNTIGNYTDETMSPKALRSTTISDELKIATGGLGQIHSIAPQSSQALVMSSTCGNSGFWINDITGKWATSTYYKDVPQPIHYRNIHAPLEARLDTMTWSSAIEAGAFPYLPSYKKFFSFTHNFKKSDPDRIAKFKNSPVANHEVRCVAEDYIRTLNLGKGENIDMLNLAMTLSPYNYGKESDNRMELMDSYIRLDREIEALFRNIDVNGPGMKNTLVFLAGTPAPVTARKEDEIWATNSGEFSPRRAISLLNMYLIALHGNGEWVTGYDSNRFFLNHDLIKEQNKDLKQMRSEAAEFLSRMAGVVDAVSLDDILAGRTSGAVTIPKRNISLDTAGDVYTFIMPGWEIIDNGTTYADPHTYPVSQRIVAPMAPVFLMGAGLAPHEITVPVDARVIAPTVTSVLRIRSPNGALLAPLRLSRK